jgi:hypothetical protein
MTIRVGHTKRYAANYDKVFKAKPVKRKPRKQKK